jgi:GntR family transcriptional regulator, rspAB operon transcriptional repressor
MTRIEVTNVMARSPVDDGEFALDRRLPAADQVYAALREAIIACRILPNEAISENRVCGMFGVSRSPVRIALTRLGEEGLIDIFPQRGTFVAPIKLQRVREGHFARVALELAILQKAADNWSSSASRAARKIVAEQERQARMSAAYGFHKADEAFHRLFATMADLDGVWRIAMNAKTHLDRVRHLANPVQGHMKKVIAEHRAVLDALDARNAADAIEAMRRHLDSLNETIARLRPLHASYFVED